ncbi:HAD-like domain-containing protein, partial [Baffinella frigidus]
MRAPFSLLLIVHLSFDPTGALRSTSLSPTLPRSEGRPCFHGRFALPLLPLMGGGPEEPESAVAEEERSPGGQIAEFESAESSEVAALGTLVAAMSTAECSVPSREAAAEDSGETGGSTYSRTRNATTVAGRRRQKGGLSDRRGAAQGPGRARVEGSGAGSEGVGDVGAEEESDGLAAGLAQLSFRESRDPSEGGSAEAGSGRGRGGGSGGAGRGQGSRRGGAWGALGGQGWQGRTRSWTSVMGVVQVARGLSPLARNLKLIILDVNGLLVHRIKGKMPPGITMSPAGTLAGGKLFERPHLRSFLDFLLPRFAVGVWSTAQDKNVHAMAAHIFGSDYQKHLAFVMDQSHCTSTSFVHWENKHKPIMLKNLSKVWDAPALAGRYSPQNTLLIDDSPYKAALNPVENAIHPPEWTAEHHADQGLDEGQDLRVFLGGLADAPDVPSHVRNSNPFPGTPHAEETLLIGKLRNAFASGGGQSGGFQGFRPGWGVLDRGRNTPASQGARGALAGGRGAAGQRG